MSMTMTPPGPAAPAAPPAIQSIAALGPPPSVPQMANDASTADPEHAAVLARFIAAKNIAEDPDIEEEIERLGQRVKQDFDIDDRSRSDWKEKYRKWLDFALQIAQPKTYPWPEACFSLDTDVLTNRGWRPVGDVGIGEMVLSRGPDGASAFHAVTERHRYTALSMVHFQGKSIDLLVTPNHRMLVESKHGRRKRQHFIEAGRFLNERLAYRYIPLTSEWGGAEPETIHGLPARAYLRVLGWYIAEGCIAGGSLSISQSRTANAEKYAQIERDLAACGISYRGYGHGFTLHVRTMPASMVDELRSLGTQDMRFVPQHVMGLSGAYLRELLRTMVAGDGTVRRRTGKLVNVSYATISATLAGQVQEICQKIGVRGTISERAATLGGVINGRPINGARTCYSVEINSKRRIQVAKMGRSAVPGRCEVACVTVEPHHTLYVRRNGKALWCGNSNIIYPLMTAAAIQFAARAYPAIIRDRNVVKGTVVGDDTGEPALDENGQPIVGLTGPYMVMQPGAKQVRANLIGEHMSWQLLTEQEEWEPQTDTLLMVLPIVGVMFRKSYFDPNLKRNVSETVDAISMCVNYHAKSFETAPRQTELIRMYPWDIEEAIRSGLFLDEDYGHDTMGQAGNGDYPVDQQDEDAPTTFMEQHRRYDLDDDGYAEPYIVTVARDSGKLARIRAGFEADGIHWTTGGRIRSIDKIQYYTKYGFIPSPDSKVYDLGFGHLLFPINEAVNTTLNQMFDAGHLQIVGGGFVGSGLSINTGALRFAMGEYKPVSVLGGTIKDQVFPLDFPGPSPILLQLLTFLVEAGERIASVKDVMVGDMPGDNTSGITTLAVIEQGLKVFSAIYKRVHRSLGYEFKKLYRLNRLYLPKTAGFEHGGEWRKITQQDYELGAGVEPISDPQMVTDMQRLGRAQLLLNFKDDGRLDGQKILMEAFSAAMIPKPERFLVQNPAPPPQFQLKSRELDIRQAREAADIQLRGMHDKAMMLREIAQAELFLAQARKLDNDAQIDWVEQHLERLRLQLDTFSAVSDAASAAQPDSDGNGSSAPSA